MYTGNLVNLRAYRKDDVPLAQAYLNNPEIKRLLAPNVPFPYTLEDEFKWYEGQSAMKDLYNFAIETKDTEKYIGGCGINQLDWKNSVATIGIFIGEPEYWGKGYGTDSMKVLIKFIFEQMNIHKIKLNVYAFNERAIKSYQKIGFVHEGTLRQEIFKDGKYHDEWVMGLFASEFK